MAGKTPPLAVRAFLEPLQRTVSCVTREIIRVSSGGYNADGRVHGALLAKGEPVALKGCDIFLSAALWYEVTHHEDDDGRGPWKVSTRTYVYTLYEPGESEILTYHWQPGGPGPGWPHLHVGTASLRDDRALDRQKHVPTGRVALEDVITLATEMGAEPLRLDHEVVLMESRTRFHKWRTWA